MNNQTSLFQKLILPLLVIVICVTGFLIFKKNPELLNQESLLASLKENSEENEIHVRTADDKAEYLDEATPATTVPKKMTHREKDEDSQNVVGRLKLEHYSAIVVGDKILAHDSKRVLALAAEDGKTLWSFDAPEGLTFAAGPIALLGTEVVASTEQGQLYSFQLATGRLLWLWQETEKFLAMPLVYKNQLLLTTEEHNGQQWMVETFDPVNLTSGNSSVALEAPLAGPPLVTGDLLIFATQTGHLQAVDLATGKIKWSAEGSSSFTCPPVEMGEHIYVCNEDGLILAYDRKNGHSGPTLEVGSKLESPIAFTPEVAMGTSVDHSGYLVAFDYRAQKRLWKYNLGTVDTKRTPHQFQLTNESLKVLNFNSEIRGWTSWTTCHVSKICLFDLRKGMLLHKMDLKGSLAGDLLPIREDLFWAPVKTGEDVVLRRWFAESSKNQP